MRTPDAEGPADKPAAISFGPFLIDPRAGRLTRAGRMIPLRPKTWSVLLHLARLPGALVTKEDLLDAVWPDVAVTPDTLTKSIGELRLALGDDSKTPRYIETVHRRGFRFIAEVRVSGQASVASAVRDGPPDVVDEQPGQRFVGRVVELQRLEQLLMKARAGERQVVFVTGPAGIGKTALVEAFLDAHIRETHVWVGRGACIEQHGEREAYMPVLEALERLARRPDGERLATLLRRAAPTWLVQMPWLLGDDAQAVRQSLQAARPERMLREFAALIEALTSELTVILVLEDLHWSDPSTVNLLSSLAQRHEPARLLVIGTYRPAEVAVREHVLSAAVHELKAHRHCVGLPVHELTEKNVQGYLRARFPDAQFPAALAAVLHHHTDGNPLFMGAVVDHMLSRGLILDTTPGWALSAPLERVDLGVPDDVGQMIEAQIETLSPADRELLEVASISGIEFAVPAIADILGSDAVAVEKRCEALARARRFLRAAGRTEWPDGSATRRYALTHELHRRVVYAGIPDRQLLQMHRRMGEVLEAAYGDRADEIAAVLAVHFEKSRDLVRAVRYLVIAGARARQRFANREALGYFESALRAVARLSDRDARQRGELEVRILLGPTLGDLHGYASDSVRENYERTEVLCERVSNPAEHFEIVYALCHFHTARADTAADAMARKLDTLAERVGTPEARLRADSVLLRIALVAGRFDEVQARMEHIPGLDSPRPVEEQPEFGPDPIIDAHSHYALALWFLGHPERACAVSRASVEAAWASGHYFTQAAALSLSGMLQLFCGHVTDALALTEKAVRISEDQGFAFWHALASAVKAQAWVLSGRSREGLDELARVRIALEATGAQVFSTHILAFLADAHRRSGSFAEALAAANEGLALAESSLSRTYRSELWRLKGEVLQAVPGGRTRRRGRRVQESGSAASESHRREAERCLLRAMELARESEAKSLELRAATSVARFWRVSGRAPEAAAALTPVCEWFGSEVHDEQLDDARSLLDELRRSLPLRSESAPRSVRPARRKISANLPRTFRI